MGDSESHWEIEKNMLGERKRERRDRRRQRQMEREGGIHIQIIEAE